MSQKGILGIDIGASGIKGAIVDVTSGELLSDRIKYLTPKPATPKAVAEVFSQLVKAFEWDDVIGCGFPAVIHRGIAMTAANIDERWIGTNVEQLFSDATGLPVYVQNDADLAGLAEIKNGSAKNASGTILLITIGSGLGSALFSEGQLVPNTELGHLYLKNMPVIAEQYAADSIRKKELLEWEEWGDRLNEFLLQIETVFCPDLIILGGGGSKRIDRFASRLTLSTEVIPGALLNNAGIVGAANLAFQKKSLTKEPRTFL